MGRNNKSIHLLRGNKNNHPNEVLDLGQPFYDKYGRSIYIGDGDTSLSELAPISGSWDKLAYEESQSDLILYISASTLINKIKSAGFLRCTSSNGGTVGLGGLFVDGSSNTDHAYVQDRWNLIYVIDPSNHNLGGILAIGDTKGVFYGKIKSTTSIEWVRLTAPNSLSYTYLDNSNKQAVTSLTLGKDSLVPSSPSSVNLGSKDNSFNTIYTKYYNGNGVNFRPTQFKEGTTNVNIGYGYDAVGAADPAATTPKAHIDAHIFYDGLNQGELSWIKAKGIIPHSNNEINFNIEGVGSNDLMFGLGGSTQTIGNYIFYNGKGTGTYSDIKCKGLYLQTGMQYSSYYNPDGAPLNDPTSQNIVDNIKSINQRLYDLGFKRASLVLNGRYTGEDSIAGRVERWGNVVLVILEKNWSSSDELHIQKIKEEDSDVSFFKSISPSASTLGENIGIIKVVTLSSAGITQIDFYNTYFKQTVIGANAAVVAGTKFAYKAEPLK